MLVAAAIAAAASAEDAPSLLLATTTSVEDSGLLGELLPTFREETGIHVRSVAVGTGAALRMGAEGNADILLTHAPEAEAKLVASGAVRARIELMENHFVLVGPPEDPAGVAASMDVFAALHKIVEAAAPFTSRADDSGTHKREVALFRAAGLDPELRWPGLSRTGAGMGQSLLIADQRAAYILSDIGSYLAFRERTKLVALTRPEPALRNVYSILLVSNERFPRVHAEEADALARFLQSETTRSRIEKFGVERFGRALFHPLSTSKD
jgi:tungstate transport system substrate-binding protein